MVFGFSILPSNMIAQIFTVNPQGLKTKGIAFSYPDGKICYRDQEIHDYLAQADSFSDFSLRCAHLNGQWRAVVRPKYDPSLICIAVDAIGSYRVFYKEENGKILLSDNGFDLMPERFPIQPDSELYFSRWGFLPNRKTLHSQVFRLSSGSCMRIDPSGIISQKRYLDYLQPTEEPLPENKDELIDYATAAFDQAFDLMLRAIDGRPVLLPLTGGRDSRLIACALKKRNYANVQTFSYGKDALIDDCLRAQRVAKDLGFPHRFIPSIPSHYGKDGYLYDEEAIDYLKYISGGASGFFFQEYLPAKVLSREYAGKNSVVLPGHIADLLLGSNFIEPRTELLTDLRQLAIRLLRLHGGNRILSSSDRETLIEQIKEQLVVYANAAKSLTPIQIYQLFLFQNLEIKYYVNSSNSWRFFGMDVWLPYADRGLHRFAFSLPDKHLFCKQLYEAVAKRYFAECGVSYLDDYSLLSVQTGRVGHLKNFFRPYVYRILERRSRIGREDSIGLAPIMKQMYSQIRKEGKYHPTTVNGLSFAWLLRSLRGGI